ncbi:MAG: hypothetical protein JXB88_26495 [Spirochaetales bacterium]|nr:hypothetical protein [Spirochaetales bacterium]
MKKAYIKMIIITLFFLLYCILLYAEAEPDVIGIVFSVKGDFILKNPDGEEKLMPGLRVRKGSEIQLAKGSGRGKIQIITSQGPVVYSRFPVLLKETGFTALSDKQQDNYIASIGGTVLTGRASSAEKNFIKDEDEIIMETSLANTLFDWHMELGVLAKEDIENGFTLVLGKEKSSKENLSLQPLYFRFQNTIDFTNISFEIMKDNTFTTVYKNGKFTRSGSDYVFSFDCFEYETDTPYIVDVIIEFSDDDEEYWEFGYSIAGTAKLKEIETEISRECAGAGSDFEKGLIKVKVYRKYNMTLKAMQILSTLGLDIEDIL